MDRVRSRRVVGKKDGGAELMNTPIILFSFDATTFQLTSIFPFADTDVEAAKLRELADKMLAAIAEDPENDLHP